MRNGVNGVLRILAFALIGLLCFCFRAEAAFDPFRNDPFFWGLAETGRDVRVDVYQEQSLDRSVFFAIGAAKYWVTTPDGQTREYRMDVAPYIKPPGRTFVPVRFLGYALGVAEQDVTWDPGTQKVGLRLAGNELGLRIGSKVRMRNGRADEMDVAPELVEPGRTMLPARFVAEGLGYQVDWDKDDQIVIVWRNGPRPEVPEHVQREVRAWTWTPSGYQIPNPKGDLINRELSARYAPGTYWTKAGLEIDVADHGNGVEIDLLVMPPDYKGSWEAYDQAETILASKLGPDFASEVMAYVRQKKSWRDKLEGSKIFRAPTGHSVVVDVGEGTQIEVWAPGVRPPGY